MLTVRSLLADRRVHGDEIRARLTDFGAVWNEGDEAVFKELCFCILAANSSAEMGLRTLAAIDDLVWQGSVEAMRDRISNGFRYWRIRPAYIASTRDHLRAVCGLRLRDWIGAMPEEARRDLLASDPGVKGVGFKEASHFLRNVGFKGLAILDKHVLACLRELGVIGRTLKANNPRRYRLIEARMRRFAADIGIPMDELDLLFWRHKTGKILK